MYTKSLLLLFIQFSFLVSVGQTSNGRNFFLDNYKNKTYTSPASVTAKSLASSSTPNATVSVETSNTIAPVIPTQFGANTNFRDGSDQRTRSDLYNGVITSMRFPAGSGSNTYFWDGNIPTSMKQYYDQQNLLQSVTGINGANANYMTPDIFINFKKDISGEAIVVVNYFYARYGITSAGTRAARVQQAANYAAAFVRKLNIDLGANVKYWEIGNECYGKWEVGYTIADATIGTLTPKEYGEDFRIFATAMKAVDPTIKISAVVYDIDDAWNAGVLPEVKDAADFLSVHEYFTSVADATSANLLAAVSQISTINTTLKSCITKYTGRPADYYPLALTEFNARGPYNCSMLNGLFVAQVLGEIVKNNFGLSTLWVSEWNWNATEQSSHGFLAVNDPDQADYTPRPSYLPYYYYGKCFGDNLVQSSSTNSSIKTYASTFTSGESGIVLINTSNATKTVKLLVNKNGQSAPIDKLHWFELYANTIEPTVAGYKKFFVNGQTSTTTGGGPDLNIVKPYQTTYSASNVFTMPAYSVFFVVANKSITSINQSVENKLSANNATIFSGTFKIAETENLKYIQIVDFNGTEILRTTKTELNSDELPKQWLILRKVYTNRVENILLLNKNQF